MEITTIPLPRCEEASIFNPAILSLGDGRTLMCCRCIPRSATIRHPWDWWVPYIGVCSAPVDGVVFDHLGGPEFIPWMDPDLVEEYPEDRYHDTTVFYMMDADGRCIAKTSMIPRHMMIDARLSRVGDGSIVITYTFSRGDERNQMRSRRIEGLSDAGLWLGGEQFMLSDFPLRQISEKNCVPIQGTDDVLYEIRSTLSAFRSNDMTILHKGPPIPWHRRLRELYGGMVEVSLGAPPVCISGDQYIGVGHMKLVYENADLIRRDTPLGRFLQDRTPSFLEYNYYFMFLFEFNLSTLEVNRMSHAFIPTSGVCEAEPYLLVFPMSIHVNDDDSKTITFGEGDDRCKMLRIDAPLIDAMLCAPDGDMEFMLVHSTERVYATILTTESYLPGIIALRNSLEAVGSRYPLVCLVVPGVEAPPGMHTISIDIIPHPFMTGYYKQHNYTKLRLFGLEGFDRIVYLDADTIVRRNIDWLFDHPSDTMVAAVRDPWNPVQFNSGVMIIDHPSKHILDDILSRVGKIEDTIDEGDQGFLRAYFRDRWTPLPRTLNCCVGRDEPIRYHDADVLHYVGQQKPWLTSSDATMNEAHTFWLQAFSSSGQPRSKPP